MKRRLAIAGIVVFWLVTTGWLVVREAYPTLFMRAAQGYRDILTDGLLVMDRWMKITFNDLPIGYSHTEIEVNEEDRANQYSVRNHMVLNINLMGQKRRVRVSARATLDAMHDLNDFQFTMRSGEYSLGVNGRRIKGTTFRVNVRGAGSSRTVHVDIPDDAVVYSPMMEMAVRELRPGQQLRIRTFDPISLTTGSMTVEALRRETIEMAGKEHKATVVAAEHQGMRVLSWLDADGQVLRQETPFGWSMEACSAEEALAADSDQPADDILVALSVPASGVSLASPERRRLRVRLRGDGLTPADLESHRQHVLESEEGWVLLGLEPEVAPRDAFPVEAVGAGMEPYLGASTYLQVDDPEVRARAAEIVGDETDSLRAARAIYTWVHRNVQKEPTISVPSASDVLRRLKGDCNEHTTLFVALARAAGLPAKITVGLAYSNDAFYYHAWPAVYVGRWLEMDPTLGRETVDATHIRLLEGDLPDQIRLMRMIGRLSVEVVAAGEDARETRE